MGSNCIKFIQRCNHFKKAYMPSKPFFKWIVIGMRILFGVLGIIALLLSVQNVSAETATDGNITISIDIPEYVSQNETFSMNFSAVNIAADPFAGGYVYLDAVLLKRSNILFYWSDVWNMTIRTILKGGVGGIEWYLPSDVQYNAGQTIPLKFRTQKVTHTVDFSVKYSICEHGCSFQVISVQDTVTSIPVFDPSVHVTVSNGSATVFEAVSGKGVDYIRFSEGNQQYIVNWDSSGNLPGEYSVRAEFSNGYESETKILLQ